MAKKDVVVEVSAEAARVFLDAAMEPFMTAPGKGTISVDEGDHDLGWRLRGAPGTPYSVEITSPDEAKIKKADNFGPKGATVGTMPFTVGKPAQEDDKDGGAE